MKKNEQDFRLFIVSTNIGIMEVPEGEKREKEYLKRQWPKTCQI